MSNAIPLTIAAVLLTAAAPVAAGPLDGTWKTDPASAKLPSRPDMLSIQNGVFRCASCTPPYAIPADGRFHKVGGRDYWDEESVTVVDPMTVTVVQRRAGKEVGRSTTTISADGATLTRAWSSADTANGQTMSGSSTETRIAAAPAGAHAISGSWRPASVGGMTDNALTVTVKDTGRTLDVAYGTGEHYSAVFGGPFVAVEGDPTGDMVKVERLSPTSVRITERHKQRMDGVATITVDPNGTAGTYSFTSARDGTTTSYTMARQ